MAEAGVEGAADIRVVVAASAAGTAFEWYDFFVFVPLATIISKVFFTGLNESAAYVFALGSFAAGFAFRPLGALIFGRIGDRAGRKGAFLVTVIMMGVATFAIGLLPTYRQVGLLSPIAFISLRLIQGIALGGEWGGAAIFIAEHSPAGKRGQFTSWIGAAAAFGLGGALIVTLTSRALVGEAVLRRLGLAHPVPGVGGSACGLRLVPTEAVGKPGVPPHARGGAPLHPALCRRLPRPRQPAPGAAGAVRHHGRPGDGLVHHLLLRAILHREGAEGGARDGERHHDRARGDLGAALRAVRRVIGPDRAQAGHGGGHGAVHRRALAGLPPHDQGGQSGPGQRPGARAGDGQSRSRTAARCSSIQWARRSSAPHATS